MEDRCDAFYCYVFADALTVFVANAECISVGDLMEIEIGKVGDFQHRRVEQQVEGV